MEAMRAMHRLRAAWGESSLLAAEIPYWLELWVFTRPLRPLASACPALLLAASVLSVVFYESVAPDQALIARYQGALNDACDHDDWTAVEVYAQRLEQLGDRSDKCRFARARAAENRGDREGVRQLLHQLAPGDRSGYPPAHFWMARKLLRERQQWNIKESELLVHHLQESLKSDSLEHQETAGVLLAHIYAARGEPGKAVRCLRPLTGRRPEYRVQLAELYASMGDERRFQSELHEALRYLREQIEERPDDVQTRLLLAKSLVLAGQMDAAESLLSDGLAVCDDQRLHQALTRLYVVMSDRLERAGDGELRNRLELLQKALSHGPDNAEALNRLASFVRSSGRYAAIARAALEDSLARGEAPVSVHLILGTIAAADGNLEEARFHLNKARDTSHQMKSDLPVLLNNLAWVLAHEDPPQLEQALLLIDEAVELAAEHPQIRETRGQILAQLEQWKEALTDLEFALRSLRDRPRLHETLAHIYKQLGDEDLSRLHKERFEQFADPGQKDVAAGNGAEEH